MLIMFVYVCNTDEACQHGIGPVVRDQTIKTRRVVFFLFPRNPLVFYIFFTKKTLTGVS